MLVLLVIWVRSGKGYWRLLRLLLLLRSFQIKRHFLLRIQVLVLQVQVDLGVFIEGASNLATGLGIPAVLQQRLSHNSCQLCGNDA